MPRVIKSQGARNRRAGHAYELQLIHEHIALGFTECVSSRSESKRMDDKGVDLMFTHPFHVQAKNVANSIQYDKTIGRMPKEKGKYNLVFHKRGLKQYVIMEKKDWYEIVDMLKREKII